MIAEQLTITTGKINDLNRQVKVCWQAGWTYVQDRGYLSFSRLKSILAAGAHFVVRVKHNTDFQVIERREVDTHLQDNGIRLRSDWTIRLTRWSDTVLRLVSYQLPDDTMVRLLTDRFDLTAQSVAQLYKERWKIENWWKWIKSVFKIKEPISRSQNGLQVQIITALIGLTCYLGYLRKLVIFLVLFMNLSFCGFRATTKQYYDLFCFGSSA